MRRSWRLIAAGTLAAAATWASVGSDARRADEAMTSGRRWEIWHEDVLVGEFSDVAGSVAGPGRESEPHPRLQATIQDAAHGDRLRLLFAEAEGVPQVLARLVSEGYRVKITTRVRRWKVYDGTQLILEVSDVPGQIVDVTAPPPPGAKPVFHSFLSASAYSAAHSDRLRKLLVEAVSLDAFLDRLRGAEFRVELLDE